MKYLPVLLLLLLSSISLSAQTIEKDTIQAAALCEKSKFVKEYAVAEKMLQKALYLYQKHKLSKNIIKAKLQLVYWNNNEVHFDKSVALLDGLANECKAAYGEKDTLVLPSVYEAEGVVYSGIGDYDKAIKSIFKAIDLYETKTNSAKDKMPCYRNLGVAYYYKGDYAKALEAYQKNKDLLIDIEGKESKNLATLYGNMAALVHAMGKYEMALDYMMSAMEIVKSDSLKATAHTMARMYNNIAAVYETLHQDSRAFEYLDKAEVLYKKSMGEEHPSMINVYANKGNILGKQGLFAKSVIFYRKAIGLLEHTNSNPNQLAKLYTGLGRMYTELQQFELAKEAIEEAIKINKSLGGEYFVGVASSYVVMASIFSKQGNFDAFYEWENKALNICLKMYGPTHPKTAASYLAIAKMQSYQKKYSEALTTFEKALDANTTNKDASVEEIIEQKYYLSSDYLNNTLNAMTIFYSNQFDETNDKNYLSKAYECVLWNQKLVASIKNGLVQSSDQQTLLKNTHGVNLNAIELAYKFAEVKDERHIKNAFQFSELNKSAILLGVLKDEAAKQFGGLPDSVVNKETAIINQIAGLEKKIIDAQLEQQREMASQLKGKLLEVKEKLHAFQEEIHLSYPQYAKLKYEESSVDVATIQNDLLDKETAMLEYFVADSSTYLFLITKTDYQVYRIPFFKGELKQYIQLARQGLSDYKMILNNTEFINKEYGKAAFALYQKLVQPALPKLVGIKHLIIVPDGEIGNIPFESLLTEELADADWQNYLVWNYLCRDFFISYSYSATWLLEAKKSKHKVINNEMLAVGALYPETYISAETRSRRLNEMRTSLKPLNSVRTEIKELELSFQGQFLYDSSATEKQLKKMAPNYGVLHLAMHGLLDAQHPIASNLVLTEDGDSLEDNFLHAYEISQMDLNAALVVLSACETGYGKFEQGEGVMSLARSFMYAGVPSLVVSLWQVNDASTAVIMKEFYQNLSDGQSKDEALTNAKMVYLSQATGQAAHPAFWAAFVQIGDAEPIHIKSNRGGYWGWIIGGLLLGLGGFFVLKRKNKKVS